MFKIGSFLLVDWVVVWPLVFQGKYKDERKDIFLCLGKNIKFGIQRPTGLNPVSTIPTHWLHDLDHVPDTLHLSDGNDNPYLLGFFFKWDFFCENYPYNHYFLFV
jgi:hypothetical protein